MKSKKISKVILFLLCIIIFSQFVVSGVVYNHIFSRCPTPDFKLTPGIVNYEEIKDKYPRSETKFLSGNNMLQGYFYQNDKSNDLLVMCHGLNSGADSYLALTIYFINQGFNVFTFDFTGSYLSDGNSTNGFPQAIIDLDNALTFIENEKMFNNLDISLFGHSWGGYAVCNVLNYDHNISSISSVSGLNSSEQTLINSASDKVGSFISSLTGQLVISYQRFKFGHVLSKMNSYDSINKVSTPVFLLHGESDEIVKYGRDSIFSDNTTFKNENVKTYKTVGENGGHTSIFKSHEAIQYMNSLNAKYEQLNVIYNNDIPYSIKCELNESIDDSLYSSLNLDVMDKISTFFKENM